MNELLREIRFADLPDNIATLDHGSGVLTLNRESPVEDLAWVLRDVAQWLESGRLSHGRMRRHLHAVGSPDHGRAEVTS